MWMEVDIYSVKAKSQKPLPVDHFDINNTNDNLKRFILLLT